MFKSAATKIAHNSTIPALAVGNRDLRPLQDLITAEKSVLVSLQRLSTDLTKASEALKAWGQGEGDDLGDVLTASTTLLSHFSAALTTWASLHHTVRDNMKSVRTREEALDDLRRRRKRVGASAESAEKKLNKMSPEHKNLGAQTDILNKLREEMRAMDGDILREEAALGDYKRKCTKNWMTLKFGGLVECCEKGNIVGDIGKGIIQEIPDIATTPGFPRPPYTGRGRVNDYVEEAQRTVDQVRFSAAPSECRYREPQAPTSEEHNHTGPSLEQTQSHVIAHQIPTPHLDFTPNAGGHGTRPPRRQSTSTNDFGVRGSLNEDPPHSQFSSLPFRGRDPAPATDEFDPFSLSTLANGGVGEEPSLMASITDALSKSRRGMSIDQTTSISHASLDTVPKYEPTTGSEGHGYFGGRKGSDAGTGHKRTTRRSTSPPVLPPGAAPAAIRAWDDGMSQGEDGAHSDRPASSSERASQQRIPSSEMDGEEEEGLPYDRDDTSYEGETRGRYNRRSGVNSLEASSEGGHEHESPEQTSTDTDSSVIHSTPSIGSETVFTHNPERSKSDVTLHSRAASRRIPRVPPPTMDADSTHMSKPPSPAQNETPPTVEYSTHKDNGTVDEHARNTAAAREISRELETLSSTSPPSSNQPVLQAHVVQQPPQGYAPSSMLARPTVSPVQPPQHSRSLSQSPYRSTPPSPLAPPSAPFTNRSVSPARPSTASTEKLPTPYGDGRPFPSPIATARGSPLHLPASSSRSNQLDTPELSVPGQRSPLYRTPPEYPRPPPPFSSPLMAKSTSSLGNVSGASGAPRTISAAAFRRQQQARSPSNTGSGDTSGPADTSPLVLRRQSPAPTLLPKNNTPMRRLSVVNPDPRPVSDDEGDFDYITAYGGPTAEREATERGHRHSPSSSVGGGVSGGGGGYAAGKYSSEV